MNKACKEFPPPKNASEANDQSIAQSKKSHRIFYTKEENDGREILFRAKRDFDGAVDSELYKFKEGSYIRRSDRYHYLLTTDGEQIKINPDTLCQYIGHCDSNNVKIFEWDILKVTKKIYCDIDFPYFVIIKDIRYLPPEIFGSNIERIDIVGNKIDNKELMKMFGPEQYKLGDL